ncbi:MAG: hypothetical protein L6Q95_05775 [Planctomycetes bacterium]|nr:hypothetical protein [Planctomycetota bacterium]
MTNRIRCALLALAAAAAAEGADEMILKVYDLGPLAVARRARFTGEGPGPAERDFSLLGTTQQQEAGRDGEDVEEDAWDPAPQVIEIVRTFVEEGELQSVDGGRRLLARMKEADHRTVARVIEQIRGSGDPPVEIDVRHLVVADRSLDDATRAMLAAPGRLEADQLAALARLDLRGGRQGGTLQVGLGRWGVYRNVGKFRYVPDFDVEIAQAAAIPDPIAAIAADGLKAAIRPFLLRDGRLLLRVVASMGDRSEPRRFVMGSPEIQDELRLRNTDFGEVEQCDYRGGALSTEMVVVPGRPGVAVLATQAGAETRWDILAITVRAAPRPVTGDTFAVTPVGALVADDPVRALTWNGQTGELALARDEQTETRLDLEDLVRKLDFAAARDGEFRGGSEYLHGGSILLRGAAEDLRLSNDRIAALEREMIRPMLLEIRLAVEGKESRTAGLLAAQLTAGRLAALAAYVRMDTVGDYDVEVAQESRIADPNHVVVTAGLFANAEISLNPDGICRLDLDLVVSAAPDGIRTSAARAGGVPLVQSVPIVERVVPVRLDLAPGRPRTVDLGESPFGPDGRLVAVISVQPQ